MTEYLTLGEVCTKGSSNIAQKELDGNEGEYEIYGASGLIKKVKFFHQDKPYIAVVKDGAGVGRTMLLPAKSSVIGTMQYIIPCDNVDIEYLYYAITYMDLSRYYMGAAIPHIYFKDYKKEKLPVPDIDTQKRIATKFRLVDKLITFRQSQLSKLSELTASRFIELFGDPVKNDRQWNTISLGDACDGIGDGLHGTPEYSEHGNYPFINGNNLMNGIIEITPATKMVDESTYYKHFIDLSNNAILISINGTLGKLALYNGEQIMLGKSACYCNLKPEINRKFVYWVMKSDSFADFLESNSTKSTIKNVGLKAMRDYKLIIPPKELQELFVSLAEQTDKSKLAVQKSLEQLETLKKSLMQKYFG